MAKWQIYKTENDTHEFKVKVVDTQKEAKEYCESNNWVSGSFNLGYFQLED